jgi:hypothetical protein
LTHERTTHQPAHPSWKGIKTHGTPIAIDNRDKIKRLGFGYKMR